MSQGTIVNKAKVKTVVAELKNCYAAMNKEIKNLEEVMAGLRGKWKGDAADQYISAYNAYQQDIKNLAVAIANCYTQLETAVQTYGSADSKARDAVANALKIKG